MPLVLATISYLSNVLLLSKFFMGLFLSVVTILYFVNRF